MAQFFEGDKRQLTPPKRPDVMAPTLDKVIAAKLNKPLDFANEDGSSGESTDLGPALSLARHTPATVTSHALQLGAVTRQVTELQLGRDDGAKVQRQPTLPFFTSAPTPVIGKPPARDSPPPRPEQPVSQSGRVRDRQATRRRYPMRSVQLSAWCMGLGSWDQRRR